MVLAIVKGVWIEKKIENPRRPEALYAAGLYKDAANGFLADVSDDGPDLPERQLVSLGVYILDDVLSALDTSVACLLRDNGPRPSL
jgi:hypothetical protein